jgi:hypothetical protein
MSKTGQWVFEMRCDAAEMTFSQFIEKHGTISAEIWHQVHFGDDRDMEPVFDEEYEALDDGS